MRWLGVLVVAVLAAPAAAQGSTATVELRLQLGDHGDRDYHLARLRVVAGPGEANAIAVSFQDGVVIVDDAAGVQSGSDGCAVGALDEVRCPVPSDTVVMAVVESGDGDDQVSLGPGVIGRVALGAGDDRAATQAGGSLDGGPGDDVLVGGAGDDGFDGGAGADVMTGGGGVDQVSYFHRRAPVTAIIGGLGGTAGEGDAIGADVEQIAGGAGPDVIRGSTRHETFYGGSGDDAIDGGGGGDFVDLGPGRDRFVSSGVVDSVYMRDGEHDSATCGRSGSAIADGGDLVLGCTHVERSRPGRVTLAASPSSFSGRSLRVHLQCSSDLRRGCAGRVTVRLGRRLAGRRRFALRAGEGGTVPVALRRFARRRLRDAGRLGVQLRVDTRDARGHPTVVRAHADAVVGARPLPATPPRPAR